MDKFLQVKFCIGPMSKNIVDEIINYSNLNKKYIIFIPSRRQIDFNGGYVNNWTTEDFCNYVKSRSKYIFIERDHGGPGQGQNENDIEDYIKSIETDCKYMDIIHIDPWKKFKKYDDGLKNTIDLINYCYNINNNIYFEVSTEEAIKFFDYDKLSRLIIDLKSSLDPLIFNRIIYYVIQSGTSLLEGNNTGMFDKKRLLKMLDIGGNNNILSKEHNGDWISDEELRFKFTKGLNAINIAPEFGMIETKVILDEIDKNENSNKILDDIFYICYNSNKWKKWVSKNFDPFKNKRKLIEICCHYCFTIPEFIKIKSIFENIDNKIKLSINQKLDSLFNCLVEKESLNDTCVVGLGKHCKYIFDVFESIYKIDYICDINDKLDNNFLKYNFSNNYNRIFKLDHIKNVVGVMHSKHQEDLSYYAITNNKNVIVEKPPGNNYLKCLEILKLAKRNNLSLYCGLCRLYDNTYTEKLKNCIKNDGIEINSIIVKQGKPFSKNELGIEPPSFHEIYMSLDLINENPTYLEIIERSNMIDKKFYNFKFKLMYKSNKNILFEFTNSNLRRHANVLVKTNEFDIDLYDGFKKKSKNPFEIEHKEFLKDTKSRNKNYYNYILAIKTLYIINQVHNGKSINLDFSFLDSIE